MEPPKNIEVIEWDSSIFWFDESGILCSISKKVGPQSLKETKQIVEKFKGLIGERKVCLLLDVTNSAEASKEVRDYAAVEFPKFVKALAMISESALGKMLANLFFSIKTQPYPTKMFGNEAEAKEWLKNYL
jgi:hypothetical protein